MKIGIMRNGGGRSLLAAETPIQHLGEQEQLSEQVLTYTLINRSEQPLERLRVYESCNCSQEQFSGGILALNQKTEMKVKWKLGNTRGPNELLIPVEYKREGTEDKKILLLKAQAVVRADIEFDRTYLLFIEPTTELTIAVRYRTNLYEVTRVRSDDSAIQAKFDAKTNRITVTLDPKGWPKDKVEGPIFVLSKPPTRRSR